MPLWVVEYAKSGRAGCKGCSDKIGNKELRIGQEQDQGEWSSVAWRHFGCATPRILRAIASTGVDNLQGLSSLRTEDQQRVRQAVRGGQVDPSDIPATAQAIDLTALPDTPKKKRPRPSAEPTASSSQAGPSSAPMQPTPSRSGSVSSQLDVEEDEDDDDDDEDQLLVVTRSQVVGVKYYRGLVNEGEYVTLQREPENPYDRNAIRAMNMSGVQVGHIPKTVAARLAPMMDRQLVTVEGEMVQGNLYGNPFQLSIDIAIYAPQSVQGQLLQQLRWAMPVPARRSSKLVPLPPTQNTGVQGTTSPSKGKGKAGSSASAAASIAAEPGETPAQTAARQRQMQKVLGALQRINGEEKRGDEVLDALSDVKDVLDLPFPKTPPSIASGDLNVDLLPHQQQGLRWMRRAEAPKLPKADSDPPVQLIKYQTRTGGGSSYYLNLASRQPTSEEPKLSRGGMLCDAMGLGKTLQVISLIVDTLEHEPEGFDKGTLVVAPVSVLSNWSKQIEDHVSASLDLTFHVYHGPGREISLKRLRTFDVVITAYPTLSGEFADDSKSAKGKGKSKAKGDEDDDWHLDDEPASKKKRKSNGKLLQVAWKRVVLDEGHTIKNPKARVSKAACALNAYSRWVCTGTPIINSPSDLGSLLTFLRSCEPLDNPDLFKRLLLRPLTSGDANGIRILKAVMASISLRRTKEMSKDGVPLVKLPKIDFFVVSIELGKAQREAYEMVAEESKRYLKEYLLGRDANPNGAQTVAPSFANVLSLLTRMRQLCLHEDLLPAGYVESMKQGVEAGPAGSVAVTPERMVELQKTFKQLLDDSEDCSICFDQMLADNARMLPCTHAFHLACLEEILKTNPLCPMDRGAISQSMFIEYQPPSEEEMDEEREIKKREIKKELAVKTKSSAKIEKLIELLRLTDPGSKSLVFSQFTRFLDLIEAHLDEAGISHCRFDGSMPQKKREAVIKSFSKPIDSKSTKPQSPQVMLISLKAGALGLNLTCASQVFLCDPWWQASIEAQAVDRTYRIGQRRDVKVFQLVAADTVEDKVLEIQARKEQLIQHAFSGTKGVGGGTAKQKKASRLEDLRELFA